ncbi:UDP-glucose 4-epimerase GalE [Kineococcus sp. SYSU DK005]|uniref:UDP-glucose 4-epimerase GalE n=1 Tax=Kineococcus sp. SYSU DK005 TaxID=3383126 RepID=UPI003D7D1896
MTWLLTGGAGYIGAHVAQVMHDAGEDVVVVDDLSTGRAGRLPATVPLHRFDIADTAALSQLMVDAKVNGVIHLAAKKSVEESVRDPLLYWQQNVQAFHSVLTAMSASGVHRIVLSSSASVYGQPSGGMVSEEAPTLPANPYGHTKLACEQMLKAAAEPLGLRWIALRYFNVAGAAGGVLANEASSSVVPLVLEELKAGRAPRIHGADYSTADGTCIRDYVHVLDLARAHVVSAQRLVRGPAAEVFNIGRGVGISVRELVDEAREVTGVGIDPLICPRRPGDVAEVVAAVDKAHEQLGWEASLGLKEMIGSEWACRSAAPAL